MIFIIWSLKCDRNPVMNRNFYPTFSPLVSLPVNQTVIFCDGNALEKHSVKRDNLQTAEQVSNMLRKVYLPNEFAL